MPGATNRPPYRSLGLQLRHVALEGPELEMIDKREMGRGDNQQGGLVTNRLAFSSDDKQSCVSQYARTKQGAFVHGTSCEQNSHLKHDVIVLAHTA